MNLARRIVDAARRMTLPLVQTAMALAVIAGALAFGSPVQAQATYSYPGNGQSIVWIGYRPGMALYADTNPGAGTVTYMRFNIPAGVTYTSAALDYVHTAYEPSEIHTVTLSLLNSEPTGDTAGMTAVRTGTTVGSFPVTSDHNTGVLTLSPAVVFRMNALSAGGGGILYLGAHVPDVATYIFGEFNTVALVGNTNQPGVTSLSPATGPTTGGNGVTITGVNFVGVTGVSFGAMPANGYTVLNSTTITALAPPGSGSVNVRVTTGLGTSATAAGNLYTYQTLPTVTEVSPNRGPTGGGTTVTITGTGFSTAPSTGAVKFGGVDATYTVNSNTQITATSPAQIAGTHDITVTTPAGMSSASGDSEFTYVAAPTVTAISPTAGPTSGGTSVTLTGTGFSFAAPTGAVKFGSLNATYTINSDTQITATSPASVAWTHNVTVTTPGGTSAASAANQFTYVAPATVTGVSPTVGPPGGGTSVVITGSGFLQAAATGAVKFGAVDATYTINSDSQITATSPAGAGVVDIRVTNAGGTSAISASDRFTYVTAPVAGNYTHTTAIPYNDGSNVATTFSLAGQVTNNPTGYLRGNATTAQGGSVSIDNAGLVTYTPPVGYRNINDAFTYTASNPAGVSAPGVVTLTLGNPTFLVTLPAPTGAVGQPYNSGGAAVTVTGGRAPYSGFSATGLPTGLTMSPSGVISGTPTTQANATVVVTLTDSSLGAGPHISTASAPLAITAPSITVSPVGAALPNAQAGVSYSQAFTGTGGIAPFTYSISGNIPPGLSFANDGVLSGTPTRTGVFNFAVTATDGSGAAYTGQTNYSMTVAPPTITIPTGLPTGSVGTPYSHTVAVSGGTPAYSFSLNGGVLPQGMSLSTDGLLSGTPSEGGLFPLSIRATDSTAGGTYSGLQGYTLTINPPTMTVSPGAGALPAAIQHAAYSQTITALGGTPGYAFSVSSGALPDGLALSGAGVISGAPTAVGTFNFTIRATDSSIGAGPYTVDVPYSLVVGVPTPPTSNPVSTTVAANSGANTVTPVLTGAPAASVSIVTAPTHGTATVSGLTIVYTPTAGYSGADSFSYRATNLGGDSAPATVTVTVTPPTLTLAGLRTTGQVGVAYGGAVTAQLGAAPYSFVLDSGVLPNGLTLATDGTLSGTPTVAGSYDFILKATDTYGASGTQTFAVVIDVPTITMTPAAGALPGGLRTVAYSQSFSATGGIGAHTFAVTGGALPAGLTLSPEGVLSGTPTGAGAFAFQITPSDSSSPAYSGPAVAYTLDVGTPVAVVQPKTVTVIAGQSVTIDAAEGAVGVDLQAAQVASAPAHGTTSVAGLTITYTADANYVGTDSFTYTVTNPGGVSASATVSITVNPRIVAGPPKSVTILAGQTATVELTEGATGSPFTGAAVVSITPANAGTASVAGRVAGGVQLYDLHFTPDNAFTGDATVLYTLSNAFATSAPGTVNVTVEARPDPSQDPEVSGLVTAQGEAARRFATAQIANVNRRLEQLHDGDRGGGFSSNLSLSGGSGLLGGGMANDPSELRRMQDTQGVMGGVLGGRGGGALGFDQTSSAPEERSQDLRTPGAGGGSDTPWGVWVSGAATFGRADDDLDREGFKFNTDGLTIGVDRRFGETLVLGGAVGWATDTSKIGSNGTRSEADAWSASLYGSWQPAEKAYVDVVLGYGKLDFDSRRFVTANGDFAYGQRNGDQWFGALTAGWDYRHPQGLHLSPYGRIEAARSTLDAFVEAGGGLYGLAYDEQTTETLTGAIGLRGDYALKTRFGQILPSFRIEYAYDLQGAGTQRIRYADWLDGEVYALDAGGLDRNRMLYGLGLDLMRKSGLRFGLGYEGMLSGDQTSGTLRLKLQTPF